MSRSPDERFADILAAVERCRAYAPHLRDKDLGAMARDAILRNLAVIGEAVRALPQESKDTAPEVPWASIAGLRNVVIHEYFRVDPHLVEDIVEHHLDRLAEALSAHGRS